MSTTTISIKFELIPHGIYNGLSKRKYRAITNEVMHSVKLLYVYSTWEPWRTATFYPVKVVQRMQFLGSSNIFSSLFFIILYVSSIKCSTVLAHILPTPSHIR